MFFTINNTPVDDASHDEIASKCQELGTRYGLSGREMEIAQYIAKGYSKPYIAEALYISDSTVRTHTKRLYEKLDVHSRQELQEKIGMGIKN